MSGSQLGTTRRHRGRPRARGPERMVTDEGLVVFVEASRALPIVDVEIVLRTGAVHDPPGREGLTRLTWRVLRMGTRRLRQDAVEDAIASLGARMGIEVAPSYVRVHGTVIRRNLDAFVALLAELVRTPAFRAGDLEQARREVLAELVSARDDDAFLASTHFRRFLFGDHPYGRPVLGTEASLRRINRRGALVDQHRAHVVRGNLVLGFAGDLDAADARRHAETHFHGLPPGPAPTDAVPAPRASGGRRVLVVDKPARTQAQIYIGTLGGRFRDRDAVPLVVANAGFGGTFTSRLTQEVRAKRGWSYGAYSRLGQDRQRDAWAMWTFPGIRDAVSCVALQLDLLDAWVDDGLTQRELDFAKKSLVNGHCFEIDTAAKRLDPAIDEELFGLTPGHLREYPRLVRAVGREDANAAVRRRISRRHVAIVLVASAKDVVPGLAALPGVRSVERVAYDEDTDARTPAS